MKLVAGLFVAVLLFALWLEFRHRCRCRMFRHNPYELIDLQEEIRKRREKENNE